MPLGPLGLRSWLLLGAIARFAAAILMAFIVLSWGPGLPGAAPYLIPFGLAYSGVGFALLLLPDRWRTPPQLWIGSVIEPLYVGVSFLLLGKAWAPYHWLVVIQMIGLTAIYGARWAAIGGLFLTATVSLADGLSPIDRPLNDVLMLAMMWVSYLGLVYFTRSEAQAVLEARTQAERAREFEALNEAKLHFINIVSHELRTPLTVINGYSKLIQGEIIGDDRAELVDVARQIAGATDRMGLLIDDLLDFGRLQSGKFKLAPETFDLTQLLRDVATVLAVLASEKNQRVAVAEPVPAVRILADPRRVEQVLINLVHNALKYSPAGTEVRLSLEEAAEGVTVRVQDQGSGISPEHQSLLFTPFFRGDHTDSPIKGVGLGLAICQGIVTAHGGQIGVESSPGNGSTFWFTLPYADGGAHHALVRSADSRHHGGRREGETLDRPVFSND